MSDKDFLKQERNGLFTVSFSNKQGLNIEEIEREFSKYGKIIQVTKAGNNKGIHFVKYEYCDEAETAIRRLKNHPTIKLLPKLTNILQSSTRAVGQKQACNLLLNNENKSSTSVMQCNESQHMINTKKNLSANNMNHNNKIMLQNKSETYQKERRNYIKDNYLNASVNSSSNNFINDEAYDDVPELVTKNSFELSKQVVLKADEVVVANIHQNYNSPYFLHLFEMFKPLAISFIQILPDIKLRYCLIYFKTEQIAMQVEKEFDNYILSGKKLIVLRTSTLIDKSKS